MSPLLTDVVLRQRALFGLCALAAILLAAAMWMTLAVAGDAGATLLPSGVPFVDQVTAVEPGGAAALAGLRAGDMIEVRDLSPQDRLRIRTLAAAGKTIALRIRRDGVQRTVTLTPRLLTQGTFWRADGWDQVLSMVGEFWDVFVAALIVWRRRESAEAALLALCLILLNLGTALSPANFWVTPWPELDMVAYALGGTIATGGIVLLATYAVQFARPISRTRRITTWCAYASAALLVLTNNLGTVGEWVGAIDPNAWFWGQPVPSLVVGLAPMALSLACAALALGAARGVELTRIAWACGSLGILYVASMIFETTTSLGTFVHAGTIIVDVAVFVAPLGLTYALLNRRLLDVGFILNRAAVAAVLSALGIAAFVLIEWALSAFFSRLGTTGVLVVNIAAAMIVGLFAPSINRLVGTLVDRVLFSRQTRARERAVRLASGLPYVESRATIARALTRDLCTWLELPSGAVFRRGEDGRFVREEAVGWDEADLLDPADVERVLLQLTADRTLLRINDDGDVTRRPHGDATPALAFPLESRQELIGFIVYSMHAGGVDVDPDERALLADAARLASRGYDAIELATRVEVAYRARIEAEAEAKETLRRANAQLERINAAQARFVPTEFLHFLRRESIVEVVLGDHTLQTMTVLFSDIRSFTTISERMAPPEIFAYLNAYLHRVGPLVREYNGFIDKYIGDAIMGLFPASPSDALRAAVALQKELRIFNLQLEGERKPCVAAGVGIHTGQVMLGTIGERDRMETTVIADAVNAASRLETATKTFGCAILVSRQAHDALTEPGEFLFRRLGSVQVKGKSEAIDAYECFSGDAPEMIERKARGAATFDEALSALQAGDVASARTGFAALADADHDDGPARYFLARCDELTLPERASHPATAR